MTKINFYDKVRDDKIEFAVIVSKTIDGKWVLCKHRDRNTVEVPGGHREAGETPLETAERELYEETGATDYEIKPICMYSYTIDNGEETFGLLCFAEIKSLEKELHSEIECVIITEELPDNWTYPDIQPKLLNELMSRNII